jgi:pimeloyl-ACP methyl ester carboxylesterase
MPAPFGPETPSEQLAGAGHAATWEAPAEFNRIVLEFLVALPGTTTESSAD